MSSLMDRGGACHVIGSSCCVHIPDHAPNVYDAIQKLHRLSSDIHEENGTWTLSGWFWGIFTSWGWKILTFLAVIAGIIITCCFCIHSLPDCCAYCMNTLKPKRPVAVHDTNATIMMMKDITDLMLIDEGILEC